MIQLLLSAYVMIAVIMFVSGMNLRHDLIKEGHRDTAPGIWESLGCAFGWPLVFSGCIAYVWNIFKDDDRKTKRNGKGKIGK